MNVTLTMLIWVGGVNPYYTPVLGAIFIATVYRIAV